MPNLTLSLKAALISTCVAIIIKLSVPFISNFDATFLWNNYILQLLKPPYLYLLINCIIISIVASSKLQHKNVHDDVSVLLPDIISTTVPEKVVVLPGGERVYDNEIRVVYGQEEEEKKKVVVVDETILADDQSGVEKSTMTTPPPALPLRTDSRQVALLTGKENEKVRDQKPPVYGRFAHRKTVKAATHEGGRSLKVSKSKREETLESTWKTITEGRSIPLNRHLKKSDTLDSHVRQTTPPPPPPKPVMKKSETFTERTTTAAEKIERANSGKLKKEPSLGQEELNRRVEAFIKKFNEEMRLQRQRSLDQYREMINRGSN